MTERLDAKQFTPLTSGEKAAIRETAVGHSISNGLLSRALLLYAFDEHLDDPALIARIEKEKSASRLRISQGARPAVNARYRDAKGE